ncbi:MAG: hypothetical protein M1821_008999 [Bathelium mastoideum]|nr:MAG: hypothetical protein M1821_008999 [Bathelium mastoideum]KAI9684299.1 MAG: hypothetical protein M1822_005772 [Bathelium mastoideum]
MNQYLRLALAALYYISLPVWITIIWLYKVIKPLYHVLVFFALPFIYLGRFMLFLISWPFFVLAKFETLYIYIGVASLVGIATGTVIYGILQILSSALHLESEESTPEMPKRTVASYRAARRKRKEQNSIGTASPPVYITKSEREGSTPLGLLSQTILEENDSDF